MEHGRNGPKRTRKSCHADSAGRQRVRKRVPRRSPNESRPFSGMPRTRGIQSRRREGPETARTAPNGPPNPPRPLASGRVEATIGHKFYSIVYNTNTNLLFHCIQYNTTPPPLPFPRVRLRVLLLGRSDAEKLKTICFIAISECINFKNLHIYIVF